VKLVSEFTALTEAHFRDGGWRRMSFRTACHLLRAGPLGGSGRQLHGSRAAPSSPLIVTLKPGHDTDGGREERQYGCAVPQPESIATATPALIKPSEWRRSRYRRRLAIIRSGRSATPLPCPSADAACDRVGVFPHQAAARDLIENPHPAAGDAALRMPVLHRRLCRRRRQIGWRR
jgi:hypothetical protein